MGDLDKLMNKLKKEDPKKSKKKSEEVENKEEEIKEEENLEDDDEDQEKEDPKEEEDQQPEKVDEDTSIESEVAVLQNDGVFRRELIITLRELVDVHKVNTQILIDLKKKFDEADGKGE